MRFTNRVNLGQAFMVKGDKDWRLQGVRFGLETTEFLAIIPGIPFIGRENEVKNKAAGGAEWHGWTFRTRRGVAKTQRFVWLLMSKNI